MVNEFAVTIDVGCVANEVWRLKRVADVCRQFLFRGGKAKNRGERQRQPDFITLAHKQAAKRAPLMHLEKQVASRITGQPDVYRKSVMLLQFRNLTSALASQDRTSPCIDSAD